MCGICGIVNFSEVEVPELKIRNMMRAMKHRGPDDEGTFISGNIGLGFVRLSIIDLSPAGHQPMSSADNRYVIVFNGEIYNFIELREELKTLGHTFRTSTDTEVLLESYIEWGEDCLDHFNGMWAFVIYDRQEGSLFAARDRFGVKPFYYVQTDEFLAFASEIPPLLQLLPGKPTPDYQSIYDYLVFNRTDHTERTFFSQVKKLQHGHCFCLSLPICYPPSGGMGGRTLGGQGGPSLKKWYDLPSHVSLSKGITDPAEFRELLSSSIALRLRSDVPVGVCLSGGLDSSSIVSILVKKFSLEKVKSFSAVYSEGQRCDESGFIEKIDYESLEKYFISPSAESFLNDLDDFITSHAEPIPGTSPYAQFQVMKLAKGNVVVTLDGQGADEELAGYHYFFGVYFKQLLRKGRLFSFVNEVFSYLKPHRSTLGLKSLIFFMVPARLKTFIRQKEKKFLRKDFLKRFNSSKIIAEGLYDSRSVSEALLDHFEYKLEHLLKWEDRNSMRFSIEARVPFLDFRLVERVLATETSGIIGRGTTKLILRDAMKGLLPEEIRLRKDKVGFETPQDEWFRKAEWQVFILGLLNSPSFRVRNIIDQDIALRLYREHLSCKKNISKEIWKWINLELWFRNFID
jgi:asparagine synthase (glutamine-hydrolysing)